MRVNVVFVYMGADDKERMRREFENSIENLHFFQTARLRFSLDGKAQKHSRQAVSSAMIHS